MPQNLQIGHEEEGYRYMGGDPGQQSSWSPVPRGQSYANGQSKGLTSTEQKAVEEARSAARLAENVVPDLDRFETINRRQNTGGWLALPGVSGFMGAIDPEVAQLNEIGSRLAPQQREPGSGSMSDKDLAVFMQSVPNATRPREANTAIINRARTEARRRAAYAEFLDQYATQNGTLAGADEMWRARVGSGEIRYDRPPEEKRPDTPDGLASATSPSDTGGSPNPPSAPTPPPANGVVRWDELSQEEKFALQKGQQVELPTGQIVTLSGSPVSGRINEGDTRVAQGVYTHENDWTDVIGALASGAAEQIPMLDEAAVATVAAFDPDRTYSEVRDSYREGVKYLNETNRGARNAGGVIGFGTSLALPGVAAGGKYIGAAKNVGQAALRGAQVGAAGGAVQGFAQADGGVEERLDSARNSALAGAAFGSTYPVAVRAFGKTMNALGGRSTSSEVTALREAGVNLTPGQRIGGGVKTFEDLAQRAPILGPAIRGARERGEESLNAAGFNQALSRINQELPRNIRAGSEAVAATEKALGREFDRAAAMVPEVAPDEAFSAGLARIAQGKTDLPPEIASQFDNIIASRLARLEGPVTGQQLRRVESEITALASRYESAADPGQRMVGEMLDEVAGEMQALMGRANPEAGQILQNARRGWADFVVLRRATANANGRRFTPAQLTTAVRGEDGSVGKGAVARGSARLQNLSRSAAEIMPDRFGNPGTADVAGYTGLGALALANLPAAAGVAGTLTALSTPYLAMGHKIVSRLPKKPSPAQVEGVVDELEVLARKDPNVRSLIDQVRALAGGVKNALGVALPAAGGVATANALSGG